jgi:phage terminase small subunit
MAQNDTELTTNQQRALDALLTTGTITEAAKVAGCGRRTLYRWMAEPSFAAALRAAESDALAALSRRLVTMGEAAAAALTDALAPERDIRDRLRAAEIVLNNLLKIKELLDFETRLRALEGKQ